MHKTHYVGCDVSKATLDVCQYSDGRYRQRQFRNTPSGHAQLIAWITVYEGPVRLVLEATGNYSLDHLLTLNAADGTALMVANPSATRQFARARMRRSIYQPSFKLLAKQRTAPASQSDTRRQRHRAIVYCQTLASMSERNTDYVRSC